MSLKKKNEDLNNEKRIRMVSKLSINYDFQIEAERNYPYIKYMNIHRFMDVLGIAQSIITDIRVGGEPKPNFSITHTDPKPAWQHTPKYILNTSTRYDLCDVESNMKELKTLFQLLCNENFDYNTISVDMGDVMKMHTRMAEKLEAICIRIGIPEEDSLVGKSMMYIQAMPTNETAKSSPIFY